MAPGNEEKQCLVYTYLFMGVPEFMLQDGLPVGQVLHFVGKGVEGLDQLLDQLR